MTRKTERGATREHAHESADREAFDNLSDEAKAELDQKLGELMVRFDETINEIRSDVAATHSDELDRLSVQYGVGAMRHYLEQTQSHCVNVTLRDFFF